MTKLNLAEDIHSLTDFKRRTIDLVESMEASGNPMVLTVNGKAKLVVQDASSYQKLLDDLDEAEAVAGIRRGLEDVAQGRTQPAKRAFAELRKKHGIPRKSRA